MFIPISILIVIAIIIVVLIAFLIFIMDLGHTSNKKDLLKQCHVEVSLHPDCESDMLLVSWTQPWDHKFACSEFAVFKTTLEACGYGDTAHFKKKSFDNVLGLQGITNVIVEPMPRLTPKKTELEED